MDNAVTTIITAVMLQTKSNYYSAYSTKSLVISAVASEFHCLINKKLPAYDTFHIKLRKCNPLEKRYLDCKKPCGRGLTFDSALVKLRFSEIHPTGAQNFLFLQKVGEQEKLQSFKDFLRWYNNRDFVPTLEVLQKMVNFHHNKGIDLLKLAYTLPNLANFCLHSSTSANFCLFADSE